MRTTTTAAAPLEAAVAFGGTPTLPTTPTHAIIRKTGEHLFTVTTLDRRMLEFTGKDKIIVGALSEARDARHCDKHDGEPMWFSVKHARGVFCRRCHNERAKEIREARKDGQEPTPRSAAAKAARAERVQEVAAKRAVSRDKAIGNLLRGQARAAEFGKGSQAKRDAYARCLMTATAAQYHLSIEQAANLADLPVWEPMTWTQYRASFTKTDDATAVA